MLMGSGPGFAPAKTSRNQAFDSYILLGSVPNPAKAARKVAPAEAVASAVQEELVCEKKRVARCCGAKKKGRWQAKQPTTLCSRCQAARQLSENQQPCAPCCRRGEADDCVAWDRLRAVATRALPKAGGQTTENEVVLRPIQQTFGVQFPGSISLFGGPEDKQEFRTIFRSIFSQRFGLDKGKLDKVIAGLTPRMKGQIMAVAQQSFSRPIVARLMQRSTHSKVEFLDVHPSCAFAREVHHPSGLSELHINRRFTEMAGCHVEELCARLAAQDIVNTPFPELDQLGMTLDAMTWLANLDPERPGQMERFVLFSQGVLTKKAEAKGTGRVVRVCLRYVPLEQPRGGGSAFAIERYLLPITPEEYDAAMLLTPHLVRPLLTAAGDTRSGRQLLTDHETERHKGLVELQEEAGGQARLERFADAVDSKVLPSLQRLSLSDSPPSHAPAPLSFSPSPAPPSPSPAPLSATSRSSVEEELGLELGGGLSVEMEEAVGVREEGEWRPVEAAGREENRASGEVQGWGAEEVGGEALAERRGQALEEGEGEGRADGGGELEWAEMAMGGAEWEGEGEALVAAMMGADGSLEEGGREAAAEARLLEAIAGDHAAPLSPCDQDLFF